MTDETPTIQDSLPPADPPADEPAAAAPSPAAQFDAPDDVADNRATGYAVYNRTIGQYVPGVLSKKPTSAEAKKLVPEGHVAAIVRV